MTSTVLIDGNSLSHAHHNATKLSIGDGALQTQAIYGMVRNIAAIVRQHQGWDVIVLWDGRAQWRYDLYPDYKGTRKAKTAEDLAHKEAYKAQIPFIQKAFQLLGIRQFHVSSGEADDMGGFLSRRISATGSYVKLYTGDKDWIQLVNERVQWIDPIRDRKVTTANFFEFTGYRTCRAFLDGKALVGDTSDNIIGIERIGEKTAPEFIAEFGSVENFFAMVDDGRFVPKLKIHQRLAAPEGREIYRRNVKLMNLMDIPAPAKESLVIVTPSFSPEKFKTLCERLCFHSILRDFDTYIEPFQPKAKKELAA